MLEDTATVTARSSSGDDLGRRSGMRAEGSRTRLRGDRVRDRYPTLRPGGLSDQLLQLLHLGLHLLVVGLPGVHLGGGEERRVGAHVGAEEVPVGAEAGDHPLQLPGGGEKKRRRKTSHQFHSNVLLHQPSPQGLESSRVFCPTGQTTAFTNPVGQKT